MNNETETSNSSIYEDMNCIRVYVFLSVCENISATGDPGF